MDAVEPRSADVEEAESWASADIEFSRRRREVGGRGMPLRLAPREVVRQVVGRMDDKIRAGFVQRNQSVEFADSCTASKAFVTCASEASNAEKIRRITPERSIT